MASAVPTHPIPLRTCHQTSPTSCGRKLTRVRALERAVRGLEAERVRLLKLLRLTAEEARLPD